MINPKGATGQNGSRSGSTFAVRMIASQSA